MVVSVALLLASSLFLIYSRLDLMPGKLGMLPKRPVSLLRTNSPPTGGAPPSSDDDELEYAENPFEEGKK